MGLHQMSKNVESFSLTFILTYNTMLTNKERREIKMNEAQFELLMTEITELRKGQNNLEEKLTNDITGLKKEITELKRGQNNLEEKLTNDITELKKGQEGLEEKLMKEIVDNRIYLGLEINKVKKEVERKYDMSCRYLNELRELMERRYQESLEDRELIHEDIKVLHILAQQNLKEHEKYNSILCEEDGDYNND